VRALTPFVGRGEELGMLARRWDRARAGKGQLTLVVGEPGLGKSRLIEEWTQGARSLELRATTDLARMWAERGERRGAHELLAPVYGRFTEGFETLDLREAKRSISPKLLDKIDFEGKRGAPAD
jgi:predicted ATPase